MEYALRELGDVLLSADVWQHLESPSVAATTDLRLRIAETYLLCHPRIKSVARHWELHLGRHERVIARRLAELGVPQSPELVRHLKRRLEVSAPRRLRRDEITADVEAQVFRRFQARAGTTDLRCECCGYHFRDRDLSSRRLSLADDNGLVRADFVDPRREADPMKPLSAKSKDRYYTGLEIDHRVPMAALGGSSVDNLQLFCRFCNLGKLDYVLPLEAISRFIAGSLSMSYPIAETGTATLATTVVASILHSGQRCSISNAGPSECELTVQPVDAEDWFVPWRLRVVSYDALSAE